MYADKEMNHRMAGVGRDLKRSSPTLLLKTELALPGSTPGFLNAGALPPGIVSGDSHKPRLGRKEMGGTVLCTEAERLCEQAAHIR